MERLESTVKEALHHGCEVHAGHGLSVQNLEDVIASSQLRALSELSIGHSIVSRALFIGWRDAIGEILKLLERSEILGQPR